ncbi:MAG: membrane protein insertase YidC [Chitinophagaceae bacterium]|nr:membrane protein insertase YidC [Chitinophagaceae bacterium]
MDRNSLIGFLLLALLFFGYFYYTKQGQMAYERKQQQIADSLSRLKPDTNNTAAITDEPVLNLDSLAKVQQHSALEGIVQDSLKGEEFHTVETRLVKVIFTNKGGQPSKVELKNFKTFDDKPLLIDNGEFNKISYSINSAANKTVETSDVYFDLADDATTVDQDGNHIVTYRLRTADGKQIEHRYKLAPDNYMIDFDIRLINGNGLFSDQVLRLNWDALATQKERGLDWETQQSHVSYVMNGEFDYENLAPGRKKEKEFVSQVDWVALNQQFFVNAIVAKDKFEGGSKILYATPKDTSLHIVATAKASMHLKVPQGNDVNIPMQLYYGPSDYKILKSYGNQMFNMVPLGTGVFAFVKYINRGFILPVFNALAKYISNYGLIIAIMTIIIRLLISPLTYQSYLSGAKMKLLRPEMDALKEKYKDDKQAFAMEQMKLYRSAGVNPVGGCIPALLQVPIFFALYSFFNSNIALRGKSFLWATDLSSYDSILNLPFNIPIYGAHVSLFTLLATVTSLLITIYGMSNMQDTGNPMMKYMPYFFPVMLLGFFNKMPSALTWYYTVSNLITLLIQFVIQTYIIDHEKVLAKLQENKLKPKKKNKWQERIEAMQRQNEKLKQMREKAESNRRK